MRVRGAVLDLDPASQLDIFSGGAAQRQALQAAQVAGIAREEVGVLGV